MKLTKEQKADAAVLVADNNIMMKLRMIGLEPYILFKKVRMHDRFFFKARAEMRDGLEKLVRQDIMQASSISGGPHDMVFDIFPDVLPIINRKSYREAKRPSLQVVVGQGNDGFLYGDADIDLASPSMSVVGFVLHMAELLTPDPTNHFQLEEKVVKEYEEWNAQNG